MEKFKLSIVKIIKKVPKLEYKLQNDKIEIFYKNKAGRQPKPILLNKKIVLEERFFEGLGLYIGECEKSPRGKALSFTNSNPEILNFILFWLQNYWGIERKELMATVISPKYLDNINQKWSKLLNLRVNQFSKVSIPKSNSGNLERVRIFRNKKVYRIVFEIIQKEILKSTTTNKIRGRGFLRGLYAAEGYVVRKKSGKLSEISICNKDRGLLILTKKVLKNLNIITGNVKECKEGRNKDDQYELKIFNLKNFKKLYNVDVFKLNCTRNKLFKDAYYEGVPERSNGLDFRNKRPSLGC